MYDVADGLRYCLDCHRATVVVLDNASGDTVCTECALVLGERYVDESSEWRTFADDGGSGKDHDRSRVGGATDPFLTHAQLGTTITYSAPRKMQAKTSADAAAATAIVPRMRGSVPAHDKALIDAFHAIAVTPPNSGTVKLFTTAQDVQLRNVSIADMADRLGLVATVRDRAKEVFKKLEEAKACPRSCRGRNRDALYAACLHIACRAEGTLRTLKGLASVTGDDAAAKTKDIGKLCNHIKKHLGEEAGRGVDMGVVVVRAGDYLRRFGSLLGMGNQEVHSAEEAARRLDDGLDVRRNPESIAAAVIYMAVQRAGADKSVRDVSMATGVSEGTIKEAYKELCPHAELLFG